MRKSLLIIFLLLTKIAFATNLQDARKQALDFGSGFKESANQTISEKNKINTPGYVNDNPKEVKYYNDNQMQNDAEVEVKNSPQGKLLSEDIAKRPQINLNLGDEFLKKSQVIEENPNEVVAMLTGSYQECRSIELKRTTNEIKTCDEYEETDCVDGRKLVQVSGNESSWNFPYLIVDISRRGGWGCSKYYSQTDIDIVDVSKIKDFVLQYVRWDDIIEIKVNDKIVYGYGNINSGSCEYATDFQTFPNINIKPFLINGKNKIFLTLGVAGMGNATVKYYLNYENQRICQTISNCKNIPSNCVLQFSKCLNSNSDNICNYRQYNYLCSTTSVSASTQVDCGSNIYCANNQCEKTPQESNQDFGVSMAYLSAINESAKDNNKQQDLKIFSGQGKNCSKETLNYNNCCKDDGWGQSIANASCSSDEIELMAMQEKKLCHYVGSYCSKKMPVIGKCMENKKTYCCFNSKISRVIMQQGKNQLGKDWGSPQAPDCVGFSADELTKLQFNKMDLGEIASDIESKVTIPDKTSIESKIKKKMEGYEIKPH